MGPTRASKYKKEPGRTHHKYTRSCGVCQPRGDPVGDASTSVAVAGSNSRVPDTTTSHPPSATTHDPAPSDPGASDV